MFFNGWFGPLRVLIVGIVAYAALIVFVRISGKRTMSKWNAFDAVITIAFGSVLASIIMTKDVALVEGLVAIALLIALQYLITWSSVRSDTIAGLVKSQPTLLLFDGRMLTDELKKARVNRSEVKAAVRSAGIASLSSVKAVVLESDGSFSVLADANGERLTAMDDVSPKIAG